MYIKLYDGIRKEKKMKGLKKNVPGILLLMCLAIGFSMLQPACVLDVKAAENYREMKLGNKPVKIGKYYFKSGSNGTLMSESRSSGYQVTPIGYRAYANGSEAYYVKECVLYKYTFVSREEAVVKKLPASGASYNILISDFHISNIYGNQIFLTRSSERKWKHWTYSYHMKTRKLKKLVSKCAIVAHHGKYVVGQNEYRTQADPYPITLYKIKSSGLKKVKKLSSKGWEPIFVGDKLYYMEYANHQMSKGTLYRCNLNGSGRKKIKTFSTSKKYDSVSVTNITAKSCDVSKEGKWYRYTYKTKKMKRIKNPY